MNVNQGIQQAILKAGSQIKLAALLDIGQSTVSEYLHGVKKIPAWRAIDIQEALDIPLKDIRPDLFNRNSDGEWD